MNRHPINKSNKPSPRLLAKRPIYPFTAIVGQEEMKLALLLNAIDPLIGGVLIMGHRGTGKSTAVRALADLLPTLTKVRDCVYGCDPLDQANQCDECRTQSGSDEVLPRERAPVTVVELPLGATEDRVCGTVDIERALKDGAKAFQPGLLARANRGFLYIDEVNLLEDHLIDLLLDAAVTGRNVVEREGISIEHPARFVLIGSGNPEEGELRPQLIDRFGLHAEVLTVTDLDERVRIVELREAFERSAPQLDSEFAGDQESLRRRIVRARKHLGEVKLSRRLLRHIADLCQSLKVEGHRGEVTIARASRALAAFERRKQVSDDDVRRVAKMALRHRLRRDPLDHTSGGGRIDQQLNKQFPSSADDDVPAKAKAELDGPTSPADKLRSKQSENDGGNNAPMGDEDGEIVSRPPTGNGSLSDDPYDSTSPGRNNKPDRIHSSSPSRGARRTSESTRRGRYSKASAKKTPGARIALDATLRAAIVEGAGHWAVDGLRSDDRSRMRRQAGYRNPLTPTALRYKRFQRKSGTLFIFAIDTSGSMALNRIAEAKGALVEVLRQSYVRRDRVALVTFRRQGAELLMQPSGSVTRARRLLDELTIGGATPLAAGISSALSIARHAANEGRERIVILLFTDGRANVPLSLIEDLSKTRRDRLIQQELEELGHAVQLARVSTVVVDTQNRFTSNGGGERVAQLLNARYVQLKSTINNAAQA
ncbi:MAG: magnesium chelatase subunit [Acidobacteriota bacterium]|nr:magnesium chelatase subunit [Acidobacteriota bacterium]